MSAEEVPDLVPASLVDSLNALIDRATEEGMIWALSTPGTPMREKALHMTLARTEAQSALFVAIRALESQVNGKERGHDVAA